MICSKCGNQLPNNAAFCPICGASSESDIREQSGINCRNSLKKDDSIIGNIGLQNNNFVVSNGFSNNKKKNKIILLTLLLFLIVVLLFVFVFNDNKNAGNTKADYYLLQSSIDSKYYVGDTYSDEAIDSYKCKNKCYFDRHSLSQDGSLGEDMSFILDGDDLVYINKVNNKGFKKVSSSNKYSIKKIDATVYEYTIDDYKYYAIISVKNNVFGVTYPYSVLDEEYGSTPLFTMGEDKKILYHVGISDRALQDNLIYLSYYNSDGIPKETIYNISTNSVEEDTSDFSAYGGVAVLKINNYIILVSCYGSDSSYVRVYGKNYVKIIDRASSEQIQLFDDRVIMNYSNKQVVYDKSGKIIQ